MTDNFLQPGAATPEKKRYEWIDNARIIAAFFIMYHHLLAQAHFGGTFGSEYLHSLVMAAPFSGRVPFFLILAGYFLARNITWSKAFDRFLWLLIPFVIWNALYCYLILQHPFTLKGIFTHLLGINGLGNSHILLFGSSEPKWPDIGPSWFLRDIMFLSLLTPLIVKFKKWIPMYLLLLAAILPLNRTPEAGAFLSPSTVFFYLLGVLLCQYRIADAYRILGPSFTKYVVVGCILSVGYVSVCAYLGISEYRGESITGGFASLVGMVFGALMFGQSGVLIETYLPNLSKRMAPCGPACFLVFMLHQPIFNLLGHVLPASVWNSWCVLSVPIIAFVAIVSFFLLMKRYTPFLMPYLGHMKVAKPKTTRN